MRWPFAEWGASAVLSGHDHLYERVMPPIAKGGSAATSLLADSSSQSNPGWGKGEGGGGVS